MIIAEIASTSGMTVSEFNNLLSAKHFQVLVSGHWKPTAKALGYSEYLDTGKRHSDGTPVKQIKWYSSILPELK